jgi:hypothetical protein
MGMIIGGLALLVITFFTIHSGANFALPKRVSSELPFTPFWTILLIYATAVATNILWINSWWITCGLWIPAGFVLGYLIERIIWIKISPEKADALYAKKRQTDETRRLQEDALEARSGRVEFTVGCLCDIDFEFPNPATTVHKFKYSPISASLPLRFWSGAKVMKCPRCDREFEVLYQSRESVVLMNSVFLILLILVAFGCGWEMTQHGWIENLQNRDVPAWTIFAFGLAALAGMGVVIFNLVRVKVRVLINDHSKRNFYQKMASGEVVLHHKILSVDRVVASVNRGI